MLCCGSWFADLSSPDVARFVEVEGGRGTLGSGELSARNLRRGAGCLEGRPLLGVNGAAAFERAEASDRAGAFIGVSVFGDGGLIETLRFDSGPVTGFLEADSC